MKKMKKYLLLLAALPVGGGAGYLVAEHADNLTSLLFGVCAMVLAMYAQVILHETGHLIAGLLTGYRFVSFRIGSLMLMRKGGKLHFTRFSLAGTGGQCLMAPPPLRGDSYPCVLYHYGGAIMNLLWAILAAVLLWRRGYSAWWVGTLAAALLMALTNGIPLKLNALDNDARNALRSRREPDVRMGFYRQLQINAALTEGGRLREMPADWFDCAPGQEHERGYMRFQWLMDQEQFDRAREYGLSIRRSPMPGIYSVLLGNDLRCLALIAGETPEAPDKNTLQIMRAMKNNPAILRTQYILALLQENDPAKANRYRTQFEKAARAYPYPGDVQADYALIRLADRKKDSTSADRG